MGQGGLKQVMTLPDAATVYNSDVNLERVVLGCILSDPTLAYQRLASIGVEDFSDDTNIKIYNALLKSWREKGTTDFASVGSYLIGDNGAITQLAQCASSVGVGSEFDVASQRLKEITAERKSHGLLIKGLNDIHQGKANLGNLIADLESAQAHSTSFDAYRCNAFFEEDMHEVEPLLLCRGKGIVYPGDITTMQGQVKTGKSTITTAIAATLTSGESNLLFSVTKPLKTLIVDTEQSDYNLNKQGRKARLMGADFGKLRVYALRSVSDTSKLLDYTIQAAYAYRPDVIIIDNIKDLVANFNDLAESQETVRRLMKLTVDLSCGIIAVIHENIGSDKARGHIGSTLAEKTSTIIQTERTQEDRDCFRVKFPTTRNAPVDEFCFRLDENICPVLVDAVTPMNKAKADKLDDLFIKVFASSPTSPLAAYEIIRQVVLIEHTSNRTAERRIKDAYNSGILFKVTGDERYYLANRLRPHESNSLDSDDLPE